MKKVNIALSINDYNLNTTGFMNNNIISFKDKDPLKTEIIYNMTTNTLIKDNKEITIKMYFDKKENNIEYILKEYNKTFFNNLEKIKLLYNESNIIINYRIDKTLYNLKLHYEEVK